MSKDKDFAFGPNIDRREFLRGVGKAASRSVTPRTALMSERDKNAHSVLKETISQALEHGDDAAHTAYSMAAKNKLAKYSLFNFGKSDHFAVGKKIIDKAKSKLWYVDPEDWKNE